ncbi:hypothetical protein [Streptomyces sp. SAS_270]|uniref:hypothetical protein n=1 Tax=Streptomyces sp. SAS_270 TaxID=3412748 RepID=UPI00403C9EE1
MDESRLTEQECLDVLACASAARLAVTRRGYPYIELVGLVDLDGEPVVLLPETSVIKHLLSAVVSPRRLVVLQTDDLADSRQSVRSVTALARPRWVVDPGGVSACHRAAAIRGIAVTADTWFLALTHPTLVGRRVPLREARLRGAPVAVRPVAGQALGEGEQ